MPSLQTIVRTSAFVTLGGFIIALFAFNATQPKHSIHTSSDPWNNNMLMGNPEAPNKMVEYTDYFCSFCAEFSKAMDDDFMKDFVDTGKITVENRIVNLLKEQSVNTVTGNRAAFCAADQDKYWQYSKKIITAIDTDFFQKGIGVKNVAKPIKIQKLDDSYFIKPAKESGLDTDKFSTCLSSDKFDATIEENSLKAIKMGVTGLPHITVNDYTATGFMGGRSELDMILKAGGVK